MLVRWPGHVAAGSTSDAIVANIDLKPTILEAAHVPPDPDRPVDGRSLITGRAARLLLSTGVATPDSRLPRLGRNADAVIRVRREPPVGSVVREYATTSFRTPGSSQISTATATPPTTPGGPLSTVLAADQGCTGACVPDRPSTHLGGSRPASSPKLGSPNTNQRSRSRLAPPATLHFEEPQSVGVRPCRWGAPDRSSGSLVLYRVGADESSIQGLRCFGRYRGSYAVPIARLCSMRSRSHLILFVVLTILLLRLLCRWRAGHAVVGRGATVMIRGRVRWPRIGVLFGEFCGVTIRRRPRSKVRSSSEGGARHQARYRPALLPIHGGFPFVEGAVGHRERACPVHLVVWGQDLGGRAGTSAR